MARRFTVIFDHVFCPTLPPATRKARQFGEGIENIRERLASISRA